MTLLDQAAARVADAVESSQKAASRLHPPGSFDLGDHPVPNGREEAWRFTPLKRLRGLHDGTFVPGGHSRVELDAPPTVGWELVDRDDPRLGRIFEFHCCIGEYHLYGDGLCETVEDYARGTLTLAIDRGARHDQALALVPARGIPAAAGALG